ncbi:MAG TPA: carboxylesterase family protein, partial [Nocardioidaceae bacterium]|nr:carboxylesterase family protein [Nocardioidaceae bacterium]
MFRLATCALATALTATLTLAAPGPAASDTQTHRAGHDRGQRTHLATFRQTTLGPILGVDESRTRGTYSWLGIPYAKPPVGKLRWRPTQTHRRWHHLRRTQEFGEGCAQPGRFFSPSPDGPHYDLDVRDGLGKPVGQEDCLTLNVFRPAHTKKQNLPVVVFIHGGSNVVGYSADPMYDGRTLARRANAVVVTVNYRLGLFGWLNLRGLTTGDPLTDSGNFGTLDQIEALRFVRANAR